mmetsp:Transcript_20055/g.41957  ORF Transcript_20055/g.41957 Transcript_20055/m.41957 type:complete len:273 (-) Transcript_20055:80-898(-)
MRCLGCDNLINDTVFNRLFGGHKEITIAILLDLVLWLIAVFSNVCIEHLTNEKDFLGLNFNISRLALGSSQRLMDHDTAVGQGTTLSLGTRSQQKSSHTGSHTKAHSVDIARNILHSIINCHTSRHGSPRAVNIEGDIFFRILIGKVQELGNKDICNFVIDTLSQEKDSILQKTTDHIHLTIVGINHRHSDGVGRGSFIRILSTRINLWGGFIGHHGPSRRHGALNNGPSTHESRICCIWRESTACQRHQGGNGYYQLHHGDYYVKRLWCFR